MEGITSALLRNITCQSLINQILSVIDNGQGKNVFEHQRPKNPEFFFKCGVPKVSSNRNQRSSVYNKIE